MYIHTLRKSRAVNTRQSYNLAPKAINPGHHQGIICTMSSQKIETLQTAYKLLHTFSVHQQGAWQKTLKRKANRRTHPLLAPKHVRRHHSSYRTTYQSRTTFHGFR